MKKLTAAFIALAMATSVSACQSTGVTPQQQAQIGGALIGGLLGYGLGKGHKNKDAAIIGGLIAGAVAGDFIGQKLSAQSKQAHTQTVAHTLEYSATGVTNNWRNPDGGRNQYGQHQREQGNVTVMNTFNRNGRYCREFQQTITVGGQSPQGYGPACRQPDGSWEII